MRVYSVQHPDPINAKARAAENIVIPPFNFIGELDSSSSDAWTPPSNFQLTGALVRATAVGTATTMLQIVKNNVYEVMVVAEFQLEASDTSGVFTLSDPLGGGLIFTPNDWLTVNSTVNSRHVGVVVQMIGVKVN